MVCRQEHGSGESQDLPTVKCQIGGRARTRPRSSDSQGSNGPIFPLKEQRLYLSQKSSKSFLPSALHPQAILLSQPLCRRQSQGGKEPAAPCCYAKHSPCSCSYQGPLLSAMGQEEWTGQARVGGSRQGRQHSLGLGGAWPVSLYLCILTCHLADAFRADDQVHSDVPSLLE